MNENQNSPTSDLSEVNCELTQAKIGLLGEDVTRSMQRSNIGSNQMFTASVGFTWPRPEPKSMSTNEVKINIETDKVPTCDASRTCGK